MAGPLANTAIMLQARGRLAQIQAALQAKLTRPGAHVTDLDRRVLFLAETALRVMNSGPQVPDFTPPHPLMQGASKFAVMGSAGPDILAGANVLTPGHDWLYRTLHKGTPDENRERVVARSTDFALAFWRRISAGISAAHLPASQETAAQQSMRAYLLGYLCHVAGDVVSSPFIDDLDFHLGLRRDPGTRFGADGPIDARVALQVLGRPSPRETQNWERLFPIPDEVPPSFFEAFRQAFQDIYGRERIRGSAEFEAALARLHPPALSQALVRDGYEFFYHGILGTGYGFGYWDWALFFWPFVVTVALEMIIFPFLPHARPAFTTGAWDLADDERAWFELFAFPVLISAPAALFYSITAAVLTNRSVGGRTVWGIIWAAASLIGMVSFFATLGTSDDDFSPVARWLLLFALPLLGPVVFFILFLVDRGTPVGGLDLLFSMPLLLFAVSAVLYFFPFLPVGAGSAALGAEPPVLITEYVLLACGVIALLIFLWSLLVKSMRDGILPEMADETFERRRALASVSRLPTDRPHLVRLFEDTTLFQDPALAPADATRDRQFFPSGRRKLVKLWWEPPGAGGATVHVRSDRFQLVFSAQPDGSGQTQIVPVPVVPSTAGEFAATLNATVINVGVPGQLRAEAVDQGGLDYELPPGATVSDHGDAETSTFAHDEAAVRFRSLGTANDDSAYVLYHAPKVAQSIRFGRGGVVPADEREEGLVPGEGTIESHGAEVTGSLDTVFSEFFRVGDRIRASGQTRIVTLIRSDTRFVVSSTFSPDLPAGTEYARVGEVRERVEGYAYVSDPLPDAPGGDTLMDQAADLGALLCMGAVPHLFPEGQRTIAALQGAAGGNRIDPVYQVFRNWDLDRRRVNEWHMLVAGRALSEKHNDSRVYDAAMTRPQPQGYAPRQNDEGEAAANRLGWVPLLRHWIALASQNVDPLDATAPGNPNEVSNRGLSRGMAFLLDLPDPVAMP